MNGYNFTERVRSVLSRAREEAARLHHEYVGTEHILLGLMREDGGVSAAVLEALRVDTVAVAAMVESTVKHGNAAGHQTDLPYTSRAKKVLELAMGEARALHHTYVGTEHLLLGVIAEEKGIAAQVLYEHGVRLDRARQETVRILSAGTATDGPTRTPRVAPTASVPSPADRAQEDLAWTRLRNALDVSARLGTQPTLALQADGTLSVSLGPDLVVTVEFPPSLGIRRREAGEPPGPPAA